MSGRRGRSGKATLEYILVFCALLLIYLLGAESDFWGLPDVWGLKNYFVLVVRKNAIQTVELVTSDYP